MNITFTPPRPPIAHVHTHTYIRAYIYIYTWTIPSHRQTNQQHTHTHMNIYMRIHVYIYTWTYLHTVKPTNSHQTKYPISTLHNRTPESFPRSMHVSTLVPIIFMRVKGFHRTQPWRTIKSSLQNFSEVSSLLNIFSFKKNTWILKSQLCIHSIRQMQNNSQKSARY